MERIEGQVVDQEELAKQVLSWITCAKRPLTSSELQHTLGVEVGESVLDEDNFPQVEDIVSVCSGLVTVDEKITSFDWSTIRHRNDLSEHKKKRFPDAETMIAMACITYLSFNIYPKGPCLTDNEFEGRLQISKLYDYAAHNWGHHARVAPSTCTRVLDFLQQKEKVEASIQTLFSETVWKKSKTLFGWKSPEGMTSLHLAAYFGIKKVVTALLQQAVDVDIKCENGKTPLSWAVKGGHETVVKLLLDNGAAVDAPNNHGWTPLW